MSFKQDFLNWTSRNEFIDKFIQESQLNANYNNQILEWIPYNEFKNIDEGGFSIVYKAIWLDGPIKYWDNDKNKWKRNNNNKVSLKNLNKSSNLNEEFLNEV